MNLPRMITALSAAHACMTDKENWAEEGEDVAFIVSRANTVINSACGIDLFREEEVSIAMIVSIVLRRHECPDHRVYELAHFLYHLLAETDMASTNLQ